MNILITGHEGFIGQNLGEYLQSKGHNVEGFEWKPNIIPDPEPYDRVIHLGAISSTTERDVEKIMEQNYESSMRLLQLCDQKGTTLMYASSASVYGDNFEENAKLQPQSGYAWSKYLFDRFVMQLKDEFQINIQGFRYFNVYGEGEEHKGDQASPYTKFAYQAKENGVIKLFEDSNNYRRDFVCVDDVCKVHEAMLDINSSDIYNVGTGRSVSFESVAQAIVNKHGGNIEYVPIPENIKSQYQEFTCAKMDKLNSVLDIDWINIEDYIHGK